MRFPGVVALSLLISTIALSQTLDSNRSGVSQSVDVAPSAPEVQPAAAPTTQPPSYANYSIMLVNPTGGTAVVLMHNPKNEVEFVEVNNTKQALSAGYVPVRAAELSEFISALKQENARLIAENARLQSEQPKQAAAVPASSAPSQADLDAQKRAQIETEKALRRQQMIQTWLMLQNMNRPQSQNLNVTVSNCTRFPALCAGK